VPPASAFKTVLKPPHVPIADKGKKINGMKIKALGVKQLNRISGKGRKEKEEKAEYCHKDKEERKANCDLWRIDLRV
jgi:hypothetical protein